MSNKNCYITTKDYSVSHEEFQILVNDKYGFLETHPQPDLKKLPEYYKSEDYISHTDSKRNLFEKVYHTVRFLSLRKKLKLINSFSNKTVGKLLDIGCGTGDFLQLVQKYKWDICGVEPNEEARLIANKKTQQSVYDVDQLNKFQKHSFDVITLWHVLEHLPNLDNQIKNLKSLLKDDGILIIAVPNYQSFDATYYKNFWAAYDVPRHLWHFDRESVSKLFSSIKMKVVGVRPLIFDSFYVSLLSEKHKRGWMNVLSAFVIGLLSNFKALRTGNYSSLIYIIKNA